MTFNDELKAAGFDLRRVLLLRHRPKERELNRALPMLAEQKHDLFNAYQQTQSLAVEQAMLKLSGRGTVAAFIRRKAKEALFVGLYSIDGHVTLSREQTRSHPLNLELAAYGLPIAGEDSRAEVVWFHLKLLDTFAAWKGRLVVDWPPPERSWWRRAHNKSYGIRYLFEESELKGKAVPWSDVNYSWSDLHMISNIMRAKLEEWRAVYYIYDTSDGKGYVGSAYGEDNQLGQEANLLGRWLNYKTTGHGGNKHLLPREPKNFRFTILQILPRDLEVADVVRIERSWKLRLHTVYPQGLNDN